MPTGMRARSGVHGIVASNTHHPYREFMFDLAFPIDPDYIDPDSHSLWNQVSSMITHKTKYALKALMVLADEKAGEAEALRIEDIAERSGAPKRFLEHILLDLKRAGMIGSRRGRNGGYELIKDPARVSLAEVLRLIDGPLAPLPCLSRRAYQRCEDCKDEKTCGVRAVFGGFYATYILMIESLTVADLQQDSRPIERFAFPEPVAES
jgi:Rrf2 family protein